MAQLERKNIIVVGAGIVGVSTAVLLQRLGHKVTLLDREEPAAGASYGNAGILAASSVVPITVPGILKKAPKMLFDPNQPLFLRWSYLPKLLPYLFRYLSHANSKSVDHISNALTELLHDCPDQHLALAKGTPAERFINFDNYLFGYDDEAAFNADQYIWQTRTKRGFEFETLTADEISTYDLSLAGRFGFGVQCKNHGWISDPGAYVKSLAHHFVEKSGDFIKANVSDLEIKNNKCTHLATDKGSMSADKYVLTLGAWSNGLAKSLGVSVPMESERGYHIEYVNPSITLRSPIMVASGKFVVTSMMGRMRCAGVVDFSGLANKPLKAPIKLLKKQMAQLFPDLTYDRIEEWMGHRPSTADSLPVIGVSPKAKNVVLGYGHQHIGLSAGPKTGQWLASLASETAINTDLSAFAADRHI